MRTSNPTLNADTFQRFDRQASGNQMTVSGTVNKTGALFAPIDCKCFYNMEYDRYGYSNPDGMYIGWFDWRFITSDSHLF